MRALTWLLLVALAIGSTLAGKLGVALAIAGVKAALVGAEYMELRHAHRLHAAGFTLGVVGLLLVLWWV